MLEPATIESSSYCTPPLHLSPGSAPVAWYALWTRSHCEQLVHDQLLQQGHHPFLPMVNRWSLRRGERQLVREPMFPGYLFSRVAMDKHTYLDVIRIRGVVRVLGDRWDRLAAIPDDEMTAVEQLAATEQAVKAFPYLVEGQRVRITCGPLAGLEGIFIKAKPRQQLLVLSVHLLQRSVAVVVEDHEVVPA